MAWRRLRKLMEQANSQAVIDLQYRVKALEERADVGKIAHELYLLQKVRIDKCQHDNQDTK